MIPRYGGIYLVQFLREIKVTFGLFQVKNVGGIIEKRNGIFRMVSFCGSDFNTDS